MVPFEPPFRAATREDAAAMAELVNVAGARFSSSCSGRKSGGRSGGIGSGRLGKG